MGVTNTERSPRPGWSTKWTSPPEASASLTVPSSAAPSDSDNHSPLPSAHCSLSVSVDSHVDPTPLDILHPSVHRSHRRSFGLCPRLRLRLERPLVRGGVATARMQPK